MAGRVAIVTGARRGIGKGIALALAKAGAAVVVSDISLEECQLVCNEITKSGGKAFPVRCDVSVSAEVRQMVDAAVKKFGRVDILVNNAGILRFEPFLDMKEETWDSVMNVNLKGCLLCSQAAARQMARQGTGGKIVNITSIAGLSAFPQIAAYNASKAGIISLTKSMALELASDKINVNAIAPGAIDTPMTKDMLADEQTKQGFLRNIPRGRIGVPADIANAVLFLASDEADYITGTVLVVDGGWICHL
ncbi:MAG: SDR family oxidoreductase [Candidatus Aenigmarchaeota archaeon]|nr:SDR family oxidoreductase [Candidatus Aenigmarchaeota archaeon]MBI5229451.1 SDR family oxidoreductase [Candidatus Micrarchaeota archaeon]